MHKVQRNCISTNYFDIIDISSVLFLNLKYTYNCWQAAFSFSAPNPLQILLWFCPSCALVLKSVYNILCVVRLVICKVVVLMCICASFHALHDLIWHGSSWLLQLSLLSTKDSPGPISYQFYPVFSDLGSNLDMDFPFSCAEPYIYHC